MILSFLIFALLILANPVFANDGPVVIDSLLTVASDTTLSFDERVRAVKRSARMDDTGRSQAAHVRLLMSFPTPDNIVAAQAAAKRAITKERDNADHIGLMAQLLWRIGPVRSNTRNVPSRRTTAILLATTGRGVSTSGKR